jgi:hypothetical protein
MPGRVQHFNHGVEIVPKFRKEIAIHWNGDSSTLL